MTEAPLPADPAVPAPAPVEPLAPVETPPQESTAPDEVELEPEDDAPDAPAPDALEPVSLKARVLSAFRDKARLVADLKAARDQVQALDHAAGLAVADNSRLRAELAAATTARDEALKALAALQAESRDVEALVGKQVAAELASLGHPAEALPAQSNADTPDADDVLATFHSLSGAKRTEFFRAHEAAILKAARG